MTLIEHAIDVEVDSDHASEAAILQIHALHDAMQNGTDRDFFDAAIEDGDNMSVGSSSIDSDTERAIKGYRDSLISHYRRQPQARSSLLFSFSRMADGTTI